METVKEAKEAMGKFVKFWMSTVLAQYLCAVSLSLSISTFIRSICSTSAMLLLISAMLALEAWLFLAVARRRHARDAKAKAHAAEG